MFGVLDELETAIDKVASSEQSLDVERMCRLAERVEFLRLRAVREFDRSCEWQADGHVSAAAGLRAKCRTSYGSARRSLDLARKLEHLPETPPRSVRERSPATTPRRSRPRTHPNATP
jgi:hypothetical protein